MPDPIIEAISLTRTYGEFKAVDDVSFNVFGGEIVGFLGPNGAGKTTTIKILTGLLQPTAGTARIAGHDIQDDSMAAKASLPNNLFSRSANGERHCVILIGRKLMSEMVKKARLRWRLLSAGLWLELNEAGTRRSQNF